MTDLEITELCAEAMGLDSSKGYVSIRCKECDEYGLTYDPIDNEGHSMELIKNFPIIAKQVIDNYLAGKINDIQRGMAEGVANWQKEKQ